MMGLADGFGGSFLMFLFFLYFCRLIINSRYKYNLLQDDEKVVFIRAGGSGWLSGLDGLWK